MSLVLALIGCIVQWFYCAALAESEVVLLAHKEPAVTGTVPIGSHVIAKRRIKKGTMLVSDDVEITQCDAWKIPVNVYRNTSDAVGKIAIYDIEKGSSLSDIVLHADDQITVQISMDKKLFKLLQNEAKRQRVTEQEMAKRLLERQLNEGNHSRK
jgi:Flp pilus assembly protein CpaB